MNNYYIFACIFAAISFIMWLIRRSSVKKLGQILDTPTSTVKQLEDRFYHIKESSNKDHREQVEVKGKIVCEKPLVGELSQKECVYYHTKVTHEYEERYKERDSNGVSRTRTRRRSDVMTKDTRYTPFYVEDNTGKILVHAEGSDMDPVQVVNKMERHPKDNNLAMGSMMLNLASIVTGTGCRTLGYRMEESILPVDRNIYVLGEISCVNDELYIRKSTDSGNSFIISTKSEEELVQNQQSTIKWIGIIRYIFIIVSIILFIIGYRLKGG